MDSPCQIKHGKAIGHANVEDKENCAPNRPSKFRFKLTPLLTGACTSPEKEKPQASEPQASVRPRPPGVPDNVPGKTPPDDDSSDEECESSRARKLILDKLGPDFDQWDPKFCVIRYTKSGKPIRKRTKPYYVMAGHNWGFLRRNEKVKKKKVGDSSKSDDEIDEKSNDDLGLHTVAYPHVVKKMKLEIAEELVNAGNFDQTVNEVFRERFYIEMPYCAWCDMRPCLCYV